MKFLFQPSRSLGISILFLALAVSSLPPSLLAQDTPLISGAAGFFSRTNGGRTTYTSAIAPIVVVPVGKRVTLESRANLDEFFSPSGPNRTYDHSHFIGVDYAQADVVVNSRMTLVGGYFLIPFGTYNERLSPMWIQNLQDAPLIYGIGNTGSGSGTGGELRGRAVSTNNFSINYIAYASAGTTNFQITSARTAGGQVNVYFPKARLEIGTSYARLLEKARLANNVGTHIWWEPASVPLKLRAEYGHGLHSQGYWIELDYRLSHFGGADSIIGRIQPVFRMQQTFRNSAGADGLPGADTQLADFGIDYRLPHEVRIDTSYSRRFSSAGNFNLWETALIYRFLTPAWKGK